MGGQVWDGIRSKSSTKKGCRSRCNRIGVLKTKRGRGGVPIEGTRRNRSSLLKEGM